MMNEEKRKARARIEFNRQQQIQNQLIKNSNERSRLDLNYIKKYPNIKSSNINIRRNSEVPTTYVEPSTYVEPKQKPWMREPRSFLGADLSNDMYKRTN